MSSSPSWPSSESTASQISPLRLRASSSPALSWSSDPEDHIPIIQRWAAVRAPKRRRPTAAGPSRRVGAESSEGTASSVTGQDVANIRACYRIPRDIGLFLPTPDDRVVSSRPGRVAIYEVCLKLGLRLPFHPFFANLLEYYSLTPSQLVPNSVRTVCAFIVLCFFHCISPRLLLFHALYTLLRPQAGRWLFQPRPGRVLKLSLPPSPPLRPPLRKFSASPLSPFRQCSPSRSPLLLLLRPSPAAAILGNGHPRQRLFFLGTAIFTDKLFLPPSIDSASLNSPPPQRPPPSDSAPRRPSPSNASAPFPPSSLAPHSTESCSALVGRTETLCSAQC